MSKQKKLQNEKTEKREYKILNIEEAFIVYSLLPVKSTKENMEEGEYFAMQLQSISEENLDKLITILRCGTESLWENLSLAVYYNNIQAMMNSIDSLVEK